MKKILKKVYMLIFHPFFFCKYTIKRKSKNFMIKGSSSKIHSRGLILGKNIRFGDDNRVDFYANGKLLIGNNSYIVNRNSFLVGADIEIGEKALIASDVMIASENHIPNPEESDIYGKLEMKPVRIGKGCWLAEKVCVMPGVTIGDFCVIGAASVVTKDIPPYSIAVGNPAKVIKTYNLNNHCWESAK